VTPWARKKLKELRRQAQPAREHGAIHSMWRVTARRRRISGRVFLNLEASGWKAKRGTALMQDDGDAGFVRRAAIALAETGQCEIVTPAPGYTPIAAAVVLRHQTARSLLQARRRRAFLQKCPARGAANADLTRHLCRDPAIAMADSTASADHRGSIRLARPPGHRRRADSLAGVIPGCR